MPRSGGSFDQYGLSSHVPARDRLTSTAGRDLCASRDPSLRLGYGQSAGDWTPEGVADPAPLGRPRQPLRRGRAGRGRVSPGRAGGAKQKENKERTSLAIEEAMCRSFVMFGYMCLAFDFFFASFALLFVHILCESVLDVHATRVVDLKGRVTSFDRSQARPELVTVSWWAGLHPARPATHMSSSAGPRDVPGLAHLSCRRPVVARR